ncbi:hypothetical protein [Halorarum salinum]|uniref:Uncharacterized protein n=1 Tax=Halorarum salinum TaxID=2743089 RepID=A0A7D5QBX2_9EURY|nr:hypothetical protein [Halobaculum salinum]QLG62200.1 hypothetical protein HUG12_10845 [Halobaculum salinum]
MSSGPNLDTGGGGSVPLEEEFVDGGEILIGKLVGTLLGAGWLVLMSGWIAILEAYVLIHLEALGAVERMYVNIITAIGGGGAETLRLSWAAGFEAAVEASPVFAPVFFSLEVVFATALLIWARRRFA